MNYFLFLLSQTDAVKGGHTNSITLKIMSRMANNNLTRKEHYKTVYILNEHCVDEMIEYGLWEGEKLW